MQFRSVAPASRGSSLIKSDQVLGPSYVLSALRAFTESVYSLYGWCEKKYTRLRGLSELDTDLKIVLVERKLERWHGSHLLIAISSFFSLGAVLDPVFYNEAFHVRVKLLSCMSSTPICILSSIRGFISPSVCAKYRLSPDFATQHKWLLNIMS